jgi:hypothetical protein
MAVGFDRCDISRKTVESPSFGLGIAPMNHITNSWDIYRT